MCGYKTSPTVGQLQECMYMFCTNGWQLFFCWATTRLYILMGGYKTFPTVGQLQDCIYNG